MTKSLGAARRWMVHVAWATAVMLGGRSVCAVNIQGSMSNFDVFNETGTNVYGAEIDLDGVLPSEVMKTYPAHFTNMTETAYATGTGTKLIFTGYNFTPPNAYITSRTGICTNGHYCVNLPGCEHFGFAVSKQASATSFYWLDAASNHVNAAPLSIPQPTWSVVGVGANAVVRAVLPPVPQPPAVIQYPDAVWVKIYDKEMAAPADLNELISYDPNNIDPAHPSVAPSLSTELETSWELLPGDGSQNIERDVQPQGSTESVLRRYEYYQYQGGYDEVHLPTSAFTTGDPPAGECGQFIAANMVAANLVVADIPEPSALLLLVGGLGMIGWRRRRGCGRRRGREGVWGNQRAGEI